MTFFPGLAAIFLSFSLLFSFAFAQDASLSTGTPKNPTCLQLRGATDPAAALIASRLSSAIPTACSHFRTVSSHTGITSTDDSYKLDSFEFQIYNPSHTVYNKTDNSSCPIILDTIIRSCVLFGKPIGTMFWGGWLVDDNKNWSISNTNYPRNGLQLPSTSPTGSALNMVTTTPGVVSASGQPTGSPAKSTWSYTWHISGSDSKSQGGTGASASTGIVKSSGKISNSGLSKLTSLPSNPTGISTSRPSLASSLSKNSTKVISSAGMTTRLSSSITSTNSNTASSLASSTSYLPVSAYSLPPSGASIAPNSPAATNAAVVVSTLLLALTADLAKVSLANAAADTAAAAEVDTAMAKIEPFFTDLGGDLTKGSCPEGVATQNQTNPFPGLDKLTDITDIAGCADEILKSLKTALTQAAPDATLVATLSADLKQLANEAQKVKENPSESTNPRQSQPSLSSNSGSSTLSSSSSLSSGCSGCCTWETAATDGGVAAITPAPADWNDIEGSLKRSFPGRLERMGEPAIRKRASTGVPILSFKGSVSSCSLATPPGLPVTTPAYPGGNVFSALDRNGNLGSLTTISRYFQMTQTGAPACTPTLARIGLAAWSTNSGPSNNGAISIDHAYENGFLQSFMQSIVDGGLPCNVLNSHFFTTTGCVQNRLEPIFGSLASFLNPDFIAMSQFLNGDAKGWILGPSFNTNPGRVFDAASAVSTTDTWSKAASKITRKNGLATNIVMAGLIINAPDTIARMQRTNNRIYKAFLAFDTWLTTTGASRGIQQTSFGWATKYRTYINSYIQARNGQIPGLLNRLIPVIQADINKASRISGRNLNVLNQEQNLLTAIKNNYVSRNGGVDFSITWEWNVNNVKRDEIPYEKRAACETSSVFNNSTIFGNGNTASFGPATKTLSVTLPSASNASLLGVN